MGMRRPVGIQKGFVRADTVLNQYQFFLIFWGVQGNKVLDRSLCLLYTSILHGLAEVPVLLIQTDLGKNLAEGDFLLFLIL